VVDDKAAKYRVSNTSMGQHVECSEAENGDIVCDTEDGRPGIEFNIEDLGTNHEIRDDHMCGEFDETCVF
jgi:hypothetical protein